MSDIDSDDLSFPEAEALLILRHGPPEHLGIARAMAVEVHCVLRGWMERDEDLRDLSPIAITELIYSRMRRIAGYTKI
jgi:hypothetical protein